MEPSTGVTTLPPYENLILHNNQEGTYKEKSRALIGCGITLIITSFINTFFSLFLMLIYSSDIFEGVLVICFMFDILHLLMGMFTVYGGYSIQERQQTIVSAMILGILTSMVKGPMFFSGLVIGLTDRHDPGLFIFSSILTGANCCLSIAISIIVCKKVCACCQRRNRTYM